ncbi:MAG: F0F1 ATP synthase subunit beta, partial [Candidatus Aminicenantes bacterium]|nr:F0F1 ATP synthase subunit beta [Candidatus Aminicenantes bacterium]
MAKVKLKTSEKAKDKPKEKPKAKSKAKEKKEEKIGKVVQVIGPVVDIEFKNVELPEIYNAIRIISERFDNTTPSSVQEIKKDFGIRIDQHKNEASDTTVPVDIVVEVQQHLGEDKVRCVSMHPTDGLARGMKAIDLQGPIQVPVGEATLGRVMNVIGEPVDHLGPIEAKVKYSIHRPPPSLEQQSTKLEMFETGIKVIDLIQPFLKGG